MRPMSTHPLIPLHTEWDVRQTAVLSVCLSSVFLLLLGCSLHSRKLQGCTMYLDRSFHRLFPKPKKVALSPL